MTPDDLITRFWPNLTPAEKQTLYAWACEDRTHDQAEDALLRICDEVLHQVELENPDPKLQALIVERLKEAAALDEPFEPHPGMHL